MKALWNLFDRYDDIRQRTGQAPVCEAAHYERATARADGLMEFVLSTPGIKRDGFDLVQSGWIFDTFQKSGSPALWRHSDRNPTDVMGNWPRVWKSSAAGLPQHLRGLLDWIAPEKNATIGPIRSMYEDGNLRASSVRWEDDGADSIEMISPNEFGDAKVDMWAQMFGGIRFRRPVLREASLVPLGADVDAISVRCRSGRMPADLLDRFVINPKLPAPTTADGREVLVLNGHPARFEIDRPAIVDLAAPPPPTPEAPKNPTYPGYAENGALLRDIQRFMRGVKTGEGLKEHLATSAAALSVTPPWERPMGRSYVELHQALGAADDAEVPALRAAVEQIGRYVFGAARIREAWEPRQLPAGLIEIWKPLGECVERTLAQALGDSERADELTDQVLTAAGPACASAMENIGWLVRMWAQISNAAGIDLPMGDDDRLVKFTERIASLTKPEPPAAAPAVDPAPGDETQALVEVAARVEDIRERRQKRQEPVSKPAGSLIERLTARAPGGMDPSAAPKG